MATTDCMRPDDTEPAGTPTYADDAGLTRPPTLEELAARVVQLEGLMRAMTKEVRTERLVVLDERGNERIRADATTGADGAQIRVSSLEQHGAEVFLVAAENPGPWGGLMVGYGGDVVRHVGIGSDGVVDDWTEAGRAQRAPIAAEQWDSREAWEATQKAIEGLRRDLYS